MSKPKFTQGPWHWELTGGPLDPPQLEGNIEYSDCNPILMCAGCKPSCMKHKNEPCPLVPSKADQSLIAAAPDMYEALEEVIKIYSFKEMVRTDKTINSPRDDPDRGKIFFTYNDLSKARKALRKARGEEE